jgi:hypothetical protein
MSRRRCHIRALIVALAVTAIAAPTAQAYPADMHDPVAQATANKQDLRSPDARDAAVQSLRGSVAAAAATKQDLRSPDARDAALPRPVSQPTAPEPVVTDSGTGGEIDWAAIGIGILLSVVAVGGIAALALRRQRDTPRMRLGA